MTAQKIGAQLDELGLTLDIGDERVVEAEVMVTTESTDGSLTMHNIVGAPRKDPNTTPVPFPRERRIVTVVSVGQELSEEQRLRIAAWFRANEVDPSTVAPGEITIHCRALGGREGHHRICFTEYYRDSDGHRIVDERTGRGVLTYPRCVRQVSPLPPDPMLPEILRDRAEKLSGAILEEGA